MRENNINTNAPDQPEKATIQKTRIELRKESGKTYARADVPFAEDKLPAAVSYDGETYFRLGATKIYKTSAIFFLVPDNFEGGDPALNSDLTNFDNARAFAQVAKDHAAEGQVSARNEGDAWISQFEAYDLQFSEGRLRELVDKELREDNRRAVESVFSNGYLFVKTEKIA